MSYYADDLVNSLASACLMQVNILAEYCRLATCSELSDEDADHLADIYEKAESDVLLSFLINEFDCILNQRLGLLNLESLEVYKNQQSWLREHLEEMPFDSDHRKDMQIMLKELNYYQGPIDGVLGKRYEKSIAKFHRRVQQLLAEKGFYRDEVDGVFGEHSICAVKEFQKAEDLKNDGILGIETFLKLQQ